MDSSRVGLCREQVDRTPTGKFIGNLVKFDRFVYVEDPTIARFAVRIVAPQPAGIVVPKVFAVECLVPIPRHVILTTVDKKIWHVLLEDTGSEVHFGGGWADFWKAYEINMDYILMFEYDHDSHFFVTIMNSDGVEVKQQVDLPVLGDSVIYVVNVSEEHMKGRTGSDENFSAHKIVFVGMSPRAVCGRCARLIAGSIGSKCGTCDLGKRRKCMAALDPLSAVCGQYLPHFFTVLKASEVEGDAQLVVESGFAATQLKPGLSILYLRVRFLNTWPILCTMSDGSSRVTHGWSKFVADNALVVGDTVMIEKSAKDASIWNVLISKHEV